MRLLFVEGCEAKDSIHLVSTLPRRAREVRSLVGLVLTRPLQYEFVAFVADAFRGIVVVDHGSSQRLAIRPLSEMVVQIVRWMFDSPLYYPMAQRIPLAADERLQVRVIHRAL